MQEYDDLMASGSKTRFPGSERHRILPGCMGGIYEEANIVFLTSAQHFLAHILLTQMHPADMGLKLAVWRMCGGREITPEEYQIGRDNWNIVNNSAEFRRKHRDAMQAKVWTKSEREACRTSALDQHQANPELAKKFSKNAKEWIESDKGKQHRDNNLKKMNSPECRAKMKASVNSPENIKRLRDKMMKMNADPEIAARSQAARNVALRKEVTCPHCNLSGKAAGMKRWHFNRCSKKGR